MYNEVHFGGDYFFKNEDFTGAKQTSDVFELGYTAGGIRVHGWIDGKATAASGKTVKVALLASDSKDAGFAVLNETTVTAGDEGVSGDIFRFVPDTDLSYMKVEVTGAEGVSGKFSVAVEYIP